MRRLKKDERIVVAMNTKGVITLQHYDPARHGRDATTYGEGDGAACLMAMTNAGKETGAPIHDYAIWKPEVKGLADADRTCDLLIGRYNTPKIVMGDPNYKPRGRSRTGFTQTF